MNNNNSTINLTNFTARKKDGSPIWPYINSLPDNYETFLFNWPAKFDPFLMKNVIETKSRLNDKFQQSYHRIEKAYNTNHPMTWVRKSELRSAYTIVKSRSLIPIFDMWNHNFKANCELNLGEIAGIPLLQYVAQEKISVGDELLLNYGLGFLFIITFSLPDCKLFNLPILGRKYNVRNFINNKYFLKT